MVDRPEQHRQIDETFRALAEKKAGLGFWKFFGRLRRLDHDWIQERVYRVYYLLKLNLKRRTKKQIPPRDPLPLLVPQHPDETRSADFMSDSLCTGIRFRTFNDIDNFNWQTLEIDMSLTSTRLVRVFEQFIPERSLSDVLRTDIDLEFLGRVH